MSRLRARLVAGLTAAALGTLTFVVAPDVSAAGTASVGVTPTAPTTDSGFATTFTVSYTCSITGDCLGTKITFPTTALAGDGPTSDFGSWLANATCPNLVVASGTATITLGTITTGTTGSCTFTAKPPNYTTYNNAQATITPTISGTGFSFPGPSATLTVTAGHHTALEASNTGASAATGRSFSFAVNVVCGQHRGGPNTGDIGYKAVSFTDTLPVGFDYTGWVNPLDTANAVGATGTYDSATRVFTYNDPSGQSCNNPVYDFLSNGNAGGNVLSIRISGTASNNGTPDPVDAKICDTSAKATVTYLDDNSTATVTVPAGTTNCVTIQPAVFGAFATKSSLGGGEYNGGQYPAPAGTGVGNNSAYTYPGDWDGTGKSAQFSVLVGEVAGSNGGVAFGIQDPMPCLDNKSPSSATYTSLAPGSPYCANPAFVPTTVTVAQGFNPTTNDSITVVYTDGTTLSVPWAAGSWVIPQTAKVIAEVDIPPFAEEGANTNAGIVFNLYGYAAASVPPNSVLTNTLVANAYNVGSNTPLVAPNTRSASVLVADPALPSGRIVSPIIQAQSQGAGTCKENVILGATGFANTVEIANGSSPAIYIDYLTPVGGTITSNATTGFTLQQRQTSSGFYQQFTTVGAAITTGTIAPATPTTNFRGTGRTLYEWKIPAGSIPRAGMWSITPTTQWVVTLPTGCAGPQQNDLTMGIDGPVTACLPYTTNGAAGIAFPAAKPVPSLPPADSDLNTNGAPSGNFCGASGTLDIAPVNPGFSIGKTVQGNLDTGQGASGNVSPSGANAIYRLTFTNTGGSNLTNPVMYDILPAVGDTFATSNQARGSEFGVALASIGALPANVTVAYSLSANPCRPEVLPTNAGCTDDWTTTAPANLATVKALRFTYTGTVFVDPANGTHTFTVPFTVTTPTTTPGETANNTVAANAYAGNLISPVEPPAATLLAKVGPTITKATTATGFAHPGDQINYKVTVTNNTAVTLTNVGVVDNLTDAASNGSAAPQVTCASLSNPTATCSGSTTTLLPGQVANFVATQTVNQDDVDYGVVTDTATVAATPPTGGTLANTSKPVTVMATRTPALTLDKTVLPTTATNAGDKVTYHFAVQNTGNVTVSGLTIDETNFSGHASLGTPTCEATTLAPGEKTTCAVEYTVDQVDVDAGKVDNTAVANATASGNTPVASNSSKATVTIAPTPALTLLKTADRTSVAKVGDKIDYSFAVQNTGNVTLTGLDIQETDFTGQGTFPTVTCTATTLAPDAKTTCTASYLATQEDLDLGKVENTAVANGTTPGNKLATSNSSQVTVTVTQSPALSLVKSVLPTTVAKSGDTVTYTYKVQNTGNVTVTGLSIAESTFTGDATLGVPTCDVTTLAPGDKATCSVDYTVDQSDVDAGKVDNTAVANATGPGNKPVASNSSKATVTIPPTPALSLVKSVDPTTATKAGDAVTYSFVVTNTGNVTVSGTTIAETAFTGHATLGTPTCDVTTLAPGDTATCSAGYTVNQADMDAGAVDNTAVANAIGPGNKPVASNASNATIGISRSASISLVKSAEPSGAAAYTAGQKITYHYVVTNTGTTTVDGVAIEEGVFTGSGSLSPVTCPTTALAPGDQLDCTASYTLTQKDVDASTLTNTATATARTLAGAPVTSAPSTVVTPATPNPVLTLKKSVTPTVVTQVGQQLTYDFAVSNDGNVTVSGVTVDDSDFGGSGSLSTPSCPLPTLLPGQHETCTATYDVLQADLDRGTIDNTAHAAGTAPGNDAVRSGDSDASVTVTQTGGLTIVKSADPVDADTKGQVITYHFLVTNSGNLTVTGMAVTEKAFTGSGTMSAISCPETTLAAGDQVDCTATYTLTQADVDAGGVMNTAFAKGTTVAGQVTSAPSQVSTPATPNAELSLTKTTDVAAVSAAGEPITYSFRVTNTGNVSITNVAIDDGVQFSGSGTLTDLTCPNTTLLPGQYVDCTARYEVTQKDVDAGQITNTATAGGTAPDDSSVTSNSWKAKVLATPSPALTLTKTADKPTVDRVGDTIDYTFHVTNSGNVTLTGVGIDEKDFSGTGTLSGIECPTGALAPGESADCRASYEVTQADLDAGKVDNTAVANASDVNEEAVTSFPSTATVTSSASGGLSLAKTADPTVVSAAGTRVTYTFTVTNTGATTLHDVTVVEKSFSGTGTISAIDCPSSTLAPKATVVCTATYSVTARDMTHDEITNTAVATGVVGVPPARAVTLAAAAPGDVVTSKASTARVRILRPTPPSSPHSSGTSTSNNHGTDNTSNTGVNLPPLIGAAIALLLAGWGALLLGRRRRGRHG